MTSDLLGLGLDNNTYYVNMLGKKYESIFKYSTLFLLSRPQILGVEVADSTSRRSFWWRRCTTETRAPAATTSARGWTGSGGSTAATTFSPTGRTTPVWSRVSCCVVSIFHIIDI